MGNLVRPRVYFVGCTEVREAGLKDYLKDTGQMDFWDGLDEQRKVIVRDMVDGILKAAKEHGRAP